MKDGELKDKKARLLIQSKGADYGLDLPLSYYTDARLVEILEKYGWRWSQSQQAWVFQLALFSSESE